MKTKRGLAFLLSVLLMLVLVACGSGETEVTEPETTVATETTTTSTSTTTTTTTTSTTTTTEPPEPEDELMFPGRYPVAFMINNTYQARPQSGLSQAKLIYQMMTEGRTTRFLMLVDAEEGVIGPVRSARPAYLDLVAQHQAFYAYAGNYRVIAPSPVVNDIRILDALKGFYGMFYRSSHRVAPHNLYTTMEDCYAWAESAYGSIEPDEPVEGLRVRESFLLPEGGEDVKSIAYQYNVSKELFQYDEEANVYNKINDGYTLVDEQTGEALEVANIMVLYRPHGMMPNQVHNKVDWIDQNVEATYITGGKKYDITWGKASHTDPIIYYLDGEELVLNPGLTWILVVDDQALATVTYN
ncbi:MAG: DUF3048 domain-containing protein [Fastidiosipila sp.]|nr:DUF3048 domain-containing protein [Fastidiosipila sp.]